MTMRFLAGLAVSSLCDGPALVLHSGADDYESRPSGDAGNRQACAVIEKD